LINIQLFSIFLLIGVLTTQSHAEQSPQLSKKQLSKIKSYIGDYKVLAGSNEKCAQGMLNIVGNDLEKGIRIGHDIYLGPFVGVVEKSSPSSCRVVIDFEMKESQVIVKTNVNKCPNQNQMVEGNTTQRLIFKKNKLVYRVTESGFTCYFEKVSEGVTINSI